MNNELRTVRLYGHLGKQFGRVHKIAVSSCAEAIRALSVVLPGFKKALFQAHSYACFYGKRNLSDKEMQMSAGGQDIRIVPVVAGAGFDLLVYAAVALAAVAVATVLLTPQPKGIATEDGPDNKASYNFNGPVNTTAQGKCVPLLYGEMFIGSATVSAGIYAEDQQ